MITKHFFANIYKEFIDFSKNNFYIYPLFLLCLGLNFYLWAWDNMELLGIFWLELVWNLFLTMFIFFLHEKKFKEAYTYYFIASIFFVTVGLYTFLANDIVHVLFINALFIIAWLRHIFIEMKWKDLKIINPVSMSLLALFFLPFFYESLLDQKVYLIQYLVIWIMIVPYISAISYKTRITAWFIWNLSAISLWAYIIYAHFLQNTLIWYDIAMPLLALPALFWYSKSVKREYWLFANA